MRELEPRNKTMQNFSRNTPWRLALKAIRKHKPQTTMHTFQTNESAGQQEVLSTLYLLCQSEYLERLNMWDN